MHHVPAAFRPGDQTRLHPELPRANGLGDQGHDHQLPEAHHQGHHGLLSGSTGAIITHERRFKTTDLEKNRSVCFMNRSLLIFAIFNLKT